MTGLRPALCVATGATLLAAALLGAHARRQRRIGRRLRDLRGRPAARPAVAGVRELGRSSLRLIAAMGQWIVQRGLLSAGTLDELRASLAATGVRGAGAIGLLIGLKILLATLSPLLMALLLSRVGGGMPPLLHRAFVAAAAIGGLLLPDTILRARRRRYLRQVERGLPDALDVMVICTQAGIGLGPAIAQVGIELQDACPAIAGEFAVTAGELAVTADTGQVLANLGTRTGIDGLRRLSATLLQTQQYGTPLTDALRGLAAELRQDILTRYEAGAARLGVLLTLPTVLFIMPCVFLIAGGPAGIQVMHVLHHQGR
ncbi:type II secretion system F family protein [Gluconacetobacter sacchari]|uniref:Type II secretion system F family protein n=2 Tax=Gluconacetobacter sacchari TaxID=92759 RepID=A0A7W4NN59_9PROT|nr:type II secretion system F family protein [Gluconacetobacter sacchari]MBB2160842.1 type II secretion system F family protein [Gluconacetobacter sacchari]